MTRLEEQQIMEGFKNEYSDFPVGELVARQPPYPDFVLTTADGKRIGIELTEVFHSQGAKKQSAVKNRLTNAVVYLLHERLSYPFTLNIFLDPNRFLWKARTNELVEELAGICDAEFAYLPNDHWGEVVHIDIDLTSVASYEANIIRRQGYRNLPSGISCIRIHRYDGLPYSYNSQSEGGLVPNLKCVDIEHLLKKKEERLAGQPALDENWLLIREGNYFTGTFDRIHADYPLVTFFQKVFLYRTGINEIIELK